MNYITSTLLLNPLYAATSPPTTEKTNKTEEKHQKVEAVKITDGDTINIKINNKIKPVRIIGINTPERGEKLYKEAAAYLENIIKEHGNTVYLKDSGQKNRGRILGNIFIKKDGKYINISVLMVKAGMAHALFIGTHQEPSEQELLSAQSEAKKSKKGIWNTERYNEPLHITSFHASVKGDDLDPNREYFRLANIEDKAINLGDFGVINCETKELICFPDITLPAGYTAIVRSGKGDNINNPYTQITIYLGKSKEFYEDSGAKIVIIDSEEKIVDQKSSRKDYKCPYIVD